jgi:hypothetical protein
MSETPLSELVVTPVWYKCHVHLNRRRELALRVELHAGDTGSSSLFNNLWGNRGVKLSEVRVRHGYHG